MESVGAAFSGPGNVDVERPDGPSRKIRWASFRSAELEAEYRRAVWRDDRRSTVWGMALLMIPAAVFARSDYVLFGLSAPFYSLAVLRSSMIIYAGLVMYLLHRVETTASRDRLVLSWSVLSLVVVITVVWSRPPEYTLSVPTEIAMLLAYFFLIQNRWQLQFWPAYAYTAGLLVVFLTIKVDVPSIGYFSVVTAFLLTNLVGTLVSWRLHYYRRSQFLAARELKTALENVRTLRGMIPICSGCKKIRDDQGFWRSVERFVMDHTEARFTHGLCPTCFEQAMAKIDALPERQRGADA